MNCAEIYESHLFGAKMYQNRANIQSGKEILRKTVSFRGTDMITERTNMPAYFQALWRLSCLSFNKQLEAHFLITNNGKNSFQLDQNL